MSTTLARALSARERWAALPEGTRAELIDNELIMSPSPTRYHQSLVLRFARALEDYLDANPNPARGETYIAPLDVDISPDYVLQPDVVYLEAAKLEVQGDRIVGTPDLIVEVLSPSNAHHDLVVKKNLYETHGVPEYWILDPETHTVEVLYLANTGHYQIHQRAQSGTIESRLLPGFVVNLDKLFKQ
jgi:Uma2 family endonuclease